MLLLMSGVTVLCVTEPISDIAGWCGLRSRILLARNKEALKGSDQEEPNKAAMVMWESRPLCSNSSWLYEIESGRSAVFRVNGPT
jgi:hypothetical protein